MHSVIGVRIACKGECKAGVNYYEEVQVPVPNSQPCQLSLCLGTPFVVMKTEAVATLNSSSDFVNQHATYLNIDLASGFAPPEWQNNVGPVLVVRTDGVDMRQADVDRAIDIVSELFDKFGDEEPFDAKAFIASRA